MWNDSKWCEYVTGNKFTSCVSSIRKERKFKGNHCTFIFYFPIINVHYQQIAKTEWIDLFPYREKAKWRHSNHLSPKRLYSDSKTAIKCSQVRAIEVLSSYRRSRLEEHRVRDKDGKSELDSCRISTENQIADALTKPLPRLTEGSIPLSEPT